MKKLYYGLRSAVLRRWCMPIRCMRLTIIASVVGLTSGCAVGNFGSVIGSVQSVWGGWVMEVYAIGLHLRPDISDDVGMTLGIARRSYVFASDEVPAPRVGWYVFRMPGTPLDRALVRHSEILGVDVHLGQPEPGVTVGLQRVLVSRPAPLEGAHFHHIVYFPDAPEHTCVSTHWEQPC